MFRSSRQIFFISLISLIILSGLFNFLIDPYGRYGTDILNARQIDPRTYIVNKLDSTWPPPKVLLFGSSRALSFNPQYSPDFPGLNVSLYGGAAEDHYCIIRYAVDELKYPVRVAIIGLEPDLLTSSHPINKSLIANSQLSRWLDHQETSKIQDFLSPPTIH